MTTQETLKHYYEYRDFSDKINRLIKSIWIKRGALVMCNPKHNLRGKAFVDKVNLYDNMLTRIQKVRYDWVDRHNKKIQTI